MVSTLMLTVNSSFNVLIYCYKDKKFRNALISTVTLRRECAGGIGNGGTMGNVVITFNVNAHSGSENSRCRILQSRA